MSTLKIASLSPLLTLCTVENKVESRTARLSRFVANDNIKEELYWLPFASKLLTTLSKNKARVV